MTLEPMDSIEKEIHPKTDQFIRIEKGNAKITFYDTEGENVIRIVFLEEGNTDTIIVPSNNWHKVENYSSISKLRLYTVYAPPAH